MARHDSVLSLITRLLLTEQRCVDPTVARAARHNFTRVEALLLGATADIAAGQVKAARRALRAVNSEAGTHARIRDALLVAAEALDRNWFPGDTGVHDQSVLPFADSIDDHSHTDYPNFGMSSEVAVVVELASGVIPAIRSLRTILDHAQVLPDPIPPFNAALDGWTERIDKLRSAGSVPAADYVRTLFADLLSRAGRFGEAEAVLAEVESQSAGQDAVLAHISLLRGDWSAGRYVNFIRVSPSPPGKEPDRETAIRHWETALTLYTKAGLHSGAASALLRLSGPLAGTGRPPINRARLERAIDMARRGGDHALLQLALVNRILEETIGGLNSTADEMAEVGHWAQREGSHSYGRGLCLLMIAGADSLRSSGDVVPARHILKAAERLAAALDMSVAPRPIQGLEIDIFGGSYRILAGAASLLEARRAVADATDALAWARAVVSGMRAYQVASSVQNLELLEETHKTLAELLEMRPWEPGPEDPTSHMLIQLHELIHTTVEEAVALGQVIRGRRAQAAGQVELAEQLFLAAEEAARSTGNRVLQCVALLELDRLPEAKGLARELSRDLPQDLAVDLLLRVGDLQGATERYSKLATSAAYAHTDASWQDLGHRADLYRRLGYADTATRLADEAVTLIEQRLGRPNRDALRSDLVGSASATKTIFSAVSAHLELARRAGASDQLDRQTAEVGAAFTVTEGSRLGLLRVASAVAQTRSSPEARELTAAWLRAASALGAELESAVSGALSGKEEDPQDLRRRVDAAEGRLAGLEARLASAAPAVIQALRAFPADLSILDIQESLPINTVLLEYHLHEDELVTFVVTPTSVSVHQQTGLKGLSAKVYEAHRLLSEGANPMTPGGFKLLQLLAAVLLEPTQDALTSSDRVLVVPHRWLFLVPWHLLPWRGKALGISHIISCLPASGLLPGLKKRPGPDKSRGSLVAGDPALLASGDLVAPATRMEAQQIAQRLETTPLLGNGVTLEAVRAGGRDVSIFTLSAPTLIDGNHPHLSSVVLSGGDRLTIGDLMGTFLGADLVFLSHCQQIGRSPIDASGIEGLMRAALVAGVRHLILPLWPVDDRYAAFFVTEIMNSVAAGQTVDSAVHTVSWRLGEPDASAWLAEYEALQRLAGEESSPRASRNTWIGDTARSLVPNQPFIHIGFPG